MSFYLIHFWHMSGFHSFVWLNIPLCMYMYHILFLHLSIGIGHWSCFCSVAIVNSFSVNIGVQIAESRPPVLLFIQPEVEPAFSFMLHGWQSDVYSARECTAPWRRSWRQVSLSVCRARQCEYISSNQ